MKTTVALLSYTLSAGNPSSAVSAEARFIDTRASEGRYRLWESTSIGYGALAADVERLAEECECPGWDGYNAAPIGVDAAQAADRFVRTLPLGVPRPSVGAEPDGQVTFEWYRSARATLSVSVDPAGLLHYAALLGSASQYGTEPFLGQVPKSILDLIRRVRQA